MPLLGPDDVLPAVPRRIAINAMSGAGKTTLARELSERLALPYVELDSLFHGPGWEPRASFLDDVQVLVATPSWVIEYQYGSARPSIAERADLMVWLDLPRWRSTWQLVRRTVVRRLQGAELWNGNVEPPLCTVLTDRDHVIRYGVRAYPRAAGRVAEFAAQHPDVPIVRLRSRAEVRRWLGSLSES